MDGKLEKFLKSEFDIEAGALDELPQEKKRELVHECRIAAQIEVKGDDLGATERFEMLCAAARALGDEAAAEELEKFRDEAAAAGGVPTEPEGKKERKADRLCDKGYAYATGKGSRKIDYAKALKCFKKAARLGSIYAINNIGAAYERNIGVKQDYRKSMKWYLKAAGLEDPVAMSNIGNLYERGRGVVKDYAEAKRWFEKSARRGHAYAYVQLGSLYEEGNGVEKDYAKAYELYRRAADKGASEGLSYLGDLYYFGHGVEKDYAKAVGFYQDAADAGDIDSLAILGRMYALGKGVETDYEKAAELFEEAAWYDSSWGNYRLGLLAKKGKGCERDYERALGLFERAAKLGHKPAARAVAYMYAQGLGVEKDMGKALGLLEEAAAGGDKKAAKALRLYRKYVEGIDAQDDTLWDAKLLDKAIVYATKMHKGQRRKGKEVPYITHPLEVMSILYRMGAASDLLAAGLLHDVAEDTQATVEDIEAKFGADIASLVAAHSEDKSKPWRERKEEDFRAIEESEDRRVKLLVMADKLANMRDLARDYAETGDRLWERFNAGKEDQAWYYRKSAEVLSCVGEDAKAAWALAEYEKLLKEVFGSVES